MVWRGGGPRVKRAVAVAEAVCHENRAARPGASPAPTKWGEQYGIGCGEGCPLLRKKTQFFPFEKGVLAHFERAGVEIALM